MSKFGSIKNCVMIGSGNLAEHLLTALSKNKIQIRQIYGRNENKAKQLAKKFRTSYTSQLHDIDQGADLYILCVSDDAIAKVATQLKKSEGLLVHTSGSTPLRSIQKKFARTGVFYPLNTFSKGDTVHFKNVPVFIEASDKKDEEKLMQLGKLIGKTAIRMKSAEREKLHLAAVMSANFSNYLFTLSDDFLKREKAGKFEYLLPLLQQSISKLENQHPQEAQTGPAKRGDKKILAHHQQLLKDYPEQKKLYKLLSSGITSRYKK